jgi:hypothetical protein
MMAMGTGTKDRVIAVMVDIAIRGQQEGLQYIRGVAVSNKEE